MEQAGQPYDWAVVGAGPAGITVVGNLLEQGIDPKAIIWIDPSFTVGDLGKYWPQVSSNTRAELFTRFLTTLSVFNYKKVANDFALNQHDPEQTCELRLVVEPLQWVTEQLITKVNTHYGEVQRIRCGNYCRELVVNGKTIQAKNTVLTIGAEPKKLHYPNLELIELADVFDDKKLMQLCGTNDSVAVFGSSHSGILILRRLLELGCQQVINFYRCPLRYALYFDDWILFDNTGLKGMTADWARQNLAGNLPHNLMRIESNQQNLDTYLPQCNKAVYAIGFESRKLPIEDVPDFDYNDKCGIIAPGLFGCGIAFPEGQVDRAGNFEYRVGLWKFMEYVQRVMPIWLRYR